MIIAEDKMIVKGDKHTSSKSSTIHSAFCCARAAYHDSQIESRLGRVTLLTEDEGARREIVVLFPVLRLSKTTVPVVEVVAVTVTWI